MINADPSGDNTDCAKNTKVVLPPTEHDTAKSLLDGLQYQSLVLIARSQNGLLVLVQNPPRPLVPVAVVLLPLCVRTLLLDMPQFRIRNYQRSMASDNMFSDTSHPPMSGVKDENPVTNFSASHPSFESDSPVPAFPPNLPCDKKSRASHPKVPVSSQASEESVFIHQLFEESSPSEEE